MKKQILFLTMMLLLFLLFCGTAAAHILPTLTADDSQSLLSSYSDFRQCSPYSFVLLKDGVQRCVYTDVTEQDYYGFGEYLRREGWEPDEESVRQTSTGIKMFIRRNGLTVSLRYNPDDEWLTMLYPAGCGIKAVTGVLSQEREEPEEPKKPELAEEPECSLITEIGRLSAGDSFAFGTYPQTAMGLDSTPIEWMVLTVDRENQRALLLSRYSLDVPPYGEDFGYGAWETSLLRKWLNEDFISCAFTAREQAGILTTAVDNSPRQAYNDLDDIGGADTQDRLFLLSCTEVNRYLDVEYYRQDDNPPYNPKAAATPTAYALEEGTYCGNAATAYSGRWLLRFNGLLNHQVSYVDFEGCFARDNVDFGLLAVRPALWVNLNSESVQTAVLRTGIHFFGQQESDADGIPALRRGNTVLYGTTPQGDADSNGAPIRWLVLDTDSKTQSALLLSYYALGFEPYAEEWRVTSWKNSTLRAWLNDEFLHQAFTGEELSGILTTKVNNGRNQGYPDWDIASANTSDRLFLLSYAEARQYFGEADGNASDACFARMDYAICERDYVSGERFLWWWLRSPGGLGDQAACVCEDGSLGKYDVNATDGAVRPAMWVKLDALRF